MAVSLTFGSIFFGGDHILPLHEGAASNQAQEALLGGLERLVPRGGREVVLSHLRQPGSQAADPLPVREWDQGKDRRDDDAEKAYEVSEDGTTGAEIEGTRGVIVDCTAIPLLQLLAGTEAEGDETNG